MKRFEVALSLQLLYLRRSRYFVVLCLPCVLLLSLITLICLVRVNGGEVKGFWSFGIMAIYLEWFFFLVMSVQMGSNALKHELNERTAKIVLTRPIGFHGWAISRVLGGAIVLTFGYVANVICIVLLNTVMDLPFDLASLGVGAILTWASFVGLYIYATMFSIIFNETTSGFLAIVVNGPLIKIMFSVVSALNSVAQQFELSLQPLVELCKAIYFVIPNTFFALSAFNTDEIYSELTRDFVERAAWAMIYEFDLWIILYLITAWVLSKKNLQ